MGKDHVKKPKTVAKKANSRNDPSKEQKKTKIIK
jgi:hypothetical protein